MNLLKTLIKRKVYYQPLKETQSVRKIIDEYRNTQFPFCQANEGDLLFMLARLCPLPHALEIGFWTGSTALYLLLGVSKRKGLVTSIDIRQSDFDLLGCEMVKASSWLQSHRFIEGNTNLVLPDLYAKKERFGLIFLDGWKTFDHLSVDVYYCSRMLVKGGCLIFDDTRMPSVNKVISLLLTHYSYKEVDYATLGENARGRLWQILSTRSLMRPYRAFVKLDEEFSLEISHNWNFFTQF